MNHGMHACTHTHTYQIFSMVSESDTNVSPAVQGDEISSQEFIGHQVLIIAKYMYRMQCRHQGICI